MRRAGAVEHGTLTAYGKLKCRCELCKARRQAADRAKRVERNGQVMKLQRVIESLELENRELAGENRLLRATVFEGENPISGPKPKKRRRKRNDHSHVPKQSGADQGVPQDAHPSELPPADPDHGQREQ